MIQHPFAIFHKICINKNMKTTTNGPHSITRINENFYLFIRGGWGGWVGGLRECGLYTLKKILDKNSNFIKKY